MSPKFGNSSISMRHVIITSIQFYEDLTGKTTSFPEVVLVLAQQFGSGTEYSLESLCQCAKGLKLKVRKNLGLIVTFIEGF